MIDPANLPDSIRRAQQRPVTLRQPSMAKIMGTAEPNPKCGCSICNPDAWWMIVCSICGNKRCPHAQDHRLECTVSNEPNQTPKMARAGDQKALEPRADAGTAHPASALCGVKFGPLVIGEKRKAKTNHENHPHGKISDSQPQRNQAPALGAAAEGEKEVLGRVLVRFTGYRVRPLDPDNFAGSCKDSLDFLRHAGLIAGDEPWKIIFETQQICVRHYNQERLVIEIEQP